MTHYVLRYRRTERLVEGFIQSRKDMGASRLDTDSVLLEARKAMAQGFWLRSFPAPMLEGIVYPFGIEEDEEGTEMCVWVRERVPAPAEGRFLETLDGELIIQTDYWGDIVHLEEVSE